MIIQWFEHYITFDTKLIPIIWNYAWITMTFLCLKFRLLDYFAWKLESSWVMMLKTSAQEQARLVIVANTPIVGLSSKISKY